MSHPTTNPIREAMLTLATDVADVAEARDASGEPNELLDRLIAACEACVDTVAATAVMHHPADPDQRRYLGGRS